MNDLVLSIERLRFQGDDFIGPGSRVGLYPERHADNVPITQRRCILRRPGTAAPGCHFQGIVVKIEIQQGYNRLLRVLHHREHRFDHIILGSGFGAYRRAEQGKNQHQCDRKLKEMFHHGFSFVSLEKQHGQGIVFCSGLFRFVF